MKNRFYVKKIIVILLSTIILIQFASFCLLKFNNKLIAENTIKEELETGKQVFAKLLELRSHQIQISNSILANDYGFKSAIASGDSLTIESALINHSARAKAPLLILTDTKNDYISCTRHDLSEETRNFNLSKIQKSLNKSSQHSSFINLKDNDDGTSALVHVFSKKVLAPTLLATLYVGYPIDANLVKSFKEATGLDFLFYIKQDSNWQLKVSSLAHDISSEFSPQKNSSNFVTKNDIEYLTLPIKIQAYDSDQIAVFIAKPLNKMIEPFNKLEQIMLLSLIASILFSLIGVYFITNKMVGKISDLAHIDGLTELGNRRYFDLTISQLISNQPIKPFSLFVMDLNKFKSINDTMGHSTGDFVLNVIAKRLKSALRSQDFIFRLGGDEFAIILLSNNKKDVKQVAMKIKNIAAEPIAHNEKLVTTGISIGIAIFPDNSSSQLELYTMADKASYIAKKDSLQYQFHDEL